MIRYVLAVLLAVALLAVAVPASERAAAIRASDSVERSVAALERAATSLLDERPTPAGVRAPQRSVTVKFPTESLASARLRSFVVDRVGSGSLVRYAVAGRPTRRIHVDAPLVAPDGGRVDLGRPTGEVTFVLSLQREAGRRVVVLTRL